MPQISIRYDNDVGVYFPGQTISGKVVVSSRNPFACKGIEIECSGVAQVHWEERGRHVDTQNIHNEQHRSDNTLHRHAEENYYNLMNKLWGDGYSSHVFPAGEQSFNFAFILPANCPSSFESKHGHVRHSCTALLSNPGAVKAMKYTRPFSISRAYDLNANFYSKSPVTISSEKTLGCLCCQSGNISFAVKLERSGFVPGEYIRINGQCYNESTKRVQNSTATLFQEVTYKAESKSKKVVREVSHVSRPEIAPGQEDNWPFVPLLVPPLPPSGLPGCNIIDIGYSLEFKMRPSGFSFSLTSSAPLTIGTIPFYDNFAGPASAAAVGLPVGQPYPGPAMGEGAAAPPPSAPPMGNPAAPPPPYPLDERYPNLPAPNYGFCVFGAEEGAKKTGGQCPTDPGYSVNGVFTPQYMMYNMPYHAPYEPDDTPLLNA